MLIVFGIQLLIAAFRTSVLWGLGSLFVPFVSLIFVIMHWNVAKKPFLRSLLGALVFGIGLALAPPDMKAIQDAAEKAQQEAAQRSTAPANP
jgi:hypothetical protein